MKKITKLSLVAAIAVAGLSSASAKPLEEAIKDVDVSGSVVYRYDNFGNDKDGQSDNTNKYKVNLNLSSKVNDYVKFNSRFNVAAANNDFAMLNKDNSVSASDQNVGVNLVHANFGINVIPATTVTIGKQGLATPWTVATDINGNEQTGTGALSITAIDNYVVGLGYFNQTNINTLADGLSGMLKDPTDPSKKVGSLDGSKDIYVATLQANFDYINVQAWYLNAIDQFDSYTAVIDGKVKLADNATIGYELRYVSLSVDDKVFDKLGAIGTQPSKGSAVEGIGEDNSLFRVAVNGKFDIVDARLAYTITDKDGGLTALDADSKNASLGWRLNTVGKADAKFLQARVGVDIIDDLNFAINYNNLEFNNGTKVKQNEIFGQLTYKMSKNLTSYLRYGQQDLDKADGSKENSGRIQVAYTF